MINLLSNDIHHPADTSFTFLIVSPGWRIFQQVRCEFSILTKDFRLTLEIFSTNYKSILHLINTREKEKVLFWL